MMEKNAKETAVLRDYVRIKVRFSEVDSIRMVWHGSYVAYLEDGREQFGRKYGLGYMQMFEAGLTAPIVDMHIRYCSMATVNDDLVLETEYVPKRGARLEFKYRLYKLLKDEMSDAEAMCPDEKTHRLVIEANTTQLWMSGEVFEVSAPEFYREWKERNGVNIG